MMPELRPSAIAIFLHAYAAHSVVDAHDVPHACRAMRARNVLHENHGGFVIIQMLIAAGLSGPPAPPCDGCTLDVPLGGSAIPLLVVLREAATHDVTDRLRATAVPAGWAVLELACPDADQWATWNGEPAWITDRIYAAARTASIDLARVYLVAGGSGATFIARHAPAWASTFAAVVFAASGEAPSPVAECPSYSFPAYFIVGDSTGDKPDRGMTATRDYFDRCKQQVQWDTSKSVAIRRLLDWLHHRLRVTTVASS